MDGSEQNMGQSDQRKVRFPSRVGIWTTTLDLVDPGEAREIATEIDELGYGSIFFGEAYGREAFTNASLLLDATENLVVTTAIANIYARDAMAANAASRTLDAAFPNRFIMGLGVSHMPLVERFRGHRYESPVATMSDYLEKVDSATFLASGLKTRPKRVIAALGPKMLDLARSQADGSHPYLVTPEHTEMARSTLGPDHMLLVEQAVALTDDEDDFLARAHAHLEFYTGLPNYRNNWTRLGFEESDYVRGGSRRLKDALVVRGGVDAVVRRIREHLDAGADHVCVQFIGRDGQRPPVEDWRAVAPELIGL